MAHISQDPELEKLKEMFPSVERDVILMILEEAHRDFNSAADILICMAGDNDEEGNEDHLESTTAKLEEFSNSRQNLHAVSKENDMLATLDAKPFLPTVSPRRELQDESYIALSGQIDSQQGDLHRSNVSRDIAQGVPGITNDIGELSLWSQVTQKEAKPFTKLQSSLKVKKPLATNLVVDPKEALREVGLPELLSEFELGRKILLILRGPPGSGKSSLAKKYIVGLQTGTVFSTDDYFMKNGRYVFNPHDLSDAHGYNQAKVKNALQAGLRFVIVDNTNTMSWEMRPYLALGAQFKYRMFIQEPNHEWSFNARVLAKQNIHNVPKDKIELMIARYEKDLTVELLANRYNIVLPTFEPPSTPSLAPDSAPLEASGTAPLQVAEPEGIGDCEKGKIPMTNTSGESSDKSSDDISDQVKQVMDEDRTELSFDNEIFESDEEEEISEYHSVHEDESNGKAKETEDHISAIVKGDDSAVTVTEEITTVPITTSSITNTTDPLVNTTTGIRADSLVNMVPIEKSLISSSTSTIPVNLAADHQVFDQPPPGYPRSVPQVVVSNVSDQNQEMPSTYLSDFWSKGDGDGIKQSWEEPPPRTEREESKKDPKPQRKSRQQKSKRTNITEKVYKEVHQIEQEQKLDHAIAMVLAQQDNQTQEQKFVEKKEEKNEGHIPFTMDPMFAVKLQETFGPPLDESVLQILDTEEILSATKLPTQLAHQIFQAWQKSLIEYISNREDRLDAKLDISSEEQFPRVVMAPNAAEYYEKVQLEKAIQESQKLQNLAVKKRPTLVVKSRSADRISKTDDEDDVTEMYMKKRNELYRKAMEAKSRKIAGAAAFYAAEARQQNQLFKDKMAEKQEKMFQAANDGNRNKNQIDLHYLTTGTAIKHLQSFLQERELIMANEIGRGVKCTVEVITGRGLNSENGRSRIRPAVSGWLNQKNYKYSELNSGALSVLLQPRDV